jgi:hypothetical protein
MKYNNKLNIIMLFFPLALSCRRSSGPTISPASINIINAMPNSNPVIPVFNDVGPLQSFGEAQTVFYPFSMLYSPLSGMNTLYIVQNTDTTPIELKQKLFAGTLTLKAGAIYSFFMSGDTTNPDTLLVQDHIPIYNDSSAGIRFINLSAGSQPMCVTMTGNSVNQLEFTGLSYKSISRWNAYNANSSIPGYYNFTIHDLATGDSLTSVTWSYAAFRSNTMIICGSEASGSSMPLQVFQMNNY